MGIINPLLLLGILAAGIPLLIHLWSKKRAKILDFSSIQFLMSINRKRLKRLRLRQILVLVLRMLIIVFLVLGLARPMLKSKLALAIANKAKRSVVIIIDNSYSMTYSDLQGSRFDIAKKSAIKILDSLNPGDNASLIFMSDIPKTIFKRMSSDIKQVKDAINNAVISHRATSVLPSLLEANSILMESNNPQKQIYVITDLDENGWQNIKQNDISELFNNNEIYIIKIGNTKIDNKAIESIDISSQLVGTGLPIQITAKIKGEKKEKAIAEFYLNGTKQGQATVSGNTVTFTYIFGKSGFQYGEIRLTPDQLTLDDSRFFVLNAYGQIKVLVVGNNKTYINLALNPITSSQDENSPVSVDNCTPDEVGSKNLGSYNIIMLSDVQKLTDEANRNLKAFNANGGNVIVFLGKKVERDWYNNKFDIMPATIGNLNDFSQKPLKIAKWDINHPIFEIFKAEGWSEGIKAVDIYSAYNAVPKPNTRIIANYDRNIIAIIESNYQSESAKNGKILLFNISPDIQVTDLPLRPVFLPLMQQTVLYANLDKYQNEHNIIVGKKYSQKIRARVTSPPSITDPEKNVIKAGVLELSKTGFSDIYLESAELSGIYKLDFASNEGSESKYFAVNLDTTTESNLIPAKEEDIISRFRQKVRFISPNDMDILSTQSEVRNADLSSIFLIISAILILLEVPLANRYKIKEQEED